MQILWIVITGVCVGGLARHAIRHREPIPIWLSIACGISGAIIGNVISGLGGIRHYGTIDWARHLIEISCSVGIVLLISPFWVARQGGSVPPSDPPADAGAGPGTGPSEPRSRV